MIDEIGNRIDGLRQAVAGDETAFNRIAEAERLGVYLRRGHLYPAMVGQTHTGRLANGFLWGGARRSRPAGDWVG